MQNQVEIFPASGSTASNFPGAKLTPHSLKNVLAGRWQVLDFLANILANVVGNSRPIVVAGGTTTRPADTTAYASGDLVANSVTAGSVVPITVSTAARFLGGTGQIRRVRLKKSGTSLTNASFRVHFYRASPTASNGDNGAWLTSESTYIGSCDVTIDKAFSDGAKGIGIPLSGAGTDINFDTLSTTGNGQSLFALIEARAAYTPASAEVFTLAVEIVQG